MAKIVATYGVPCFDAALFEGHELVVPPLEKAFSREELMAALPGAVAVLACTRFDREMIAVSDALKLIVCYGAGYDAIDVAAATERGVMVANIPDAVTAATAELAVTLMLTLARKVTKYNDAIRRLPARDVFVLGRDMSATLDGGTLGIVGMGRIGARVADICRALGMRVLYTSRTPKPARDRLGDRRVPLDELLSQSDVVSLHCPCTPETRGLLSRERIALMKPTAFLVNTARGALADEEALTDALRENRLAGAGLDVFPNEPNVNPAYFALQNVVLTPHKGSNTCRTRRLMAEAAKARILAVLDGKTPDNLLNPQVLG